MRIAIAGFSLESVSFLPHAMTIEEFERNAKRGAAIAEARRGTNTVPGGFVKILEEAGAEIVGVVHTEAGAAGPCSDEAFDFYCKEIADGLAAIKDEIDGVLLHLHGAMATPTRTDPEALVCKAAREAVGKAVPIVLALDYHGNIDEDTIAPVNAVFGYHHSPHIDMGRTGERAAECLVRLLKKEIDPKFAIAKPGVMVPSIFSATSLETLAAIQAEARRLEKESTRYLDISVFAGFSYADVENCGFSVVAVADAEVPTSIVQGLSERIWNDRHKLNDPFHVYGLSDGVAAAIEKAKQAKAPIAILEHADRVNDSTHVLRELLKQGAKKFAVPFLWDPEAAAAAVAAGKGAEVTLSVGGHSSDRAGGPVEIRGKVLFAGDLVYNVTGPMAHGSRVDLGPTALIDTGSAVISITTHSRTAIDEDAFKQFGLDARDFDIVVLRSKTHFRAVWEPLAEEILVIDTPDWGPADLKTLPYRHVPTDRVYPFVDRD
jgi:microcystin degradation protein MlrC